MASASRTELWQELEALGIEFDMNTVRSQTGPHDSGSGTDAGALPDSFASGIPDDAYEVVEAEHVGTMPTG